MIVRSSSDDVAAAVSISSSSLLQSVPAEGGVAEGEPQAGVLSAADIRSSLHSSSSASTEGGRGSGAATLLAAAKQQTSSSGDVQLPLSQALAVLSNVRV